MWVKIGEHLINLDNVVNVKKSEGISAHFLVFDHIDKEKRTIIKFDSMDDLNRSLSKIKDGLRLKHVSLLDLRE